MNFMVGNIVLVKHIIQFFLLEYRVYLWYGLVIQFYGYSRFKGISIGYTNNKKMSKKWKEFTIESESFLKLKSNVNKVDSNDLSCPIESVTMEYKLSTSPKKYCHNSSKNLAFDG